MYHAIRWIFGLVTVILLLYAFVLYGKATKRVKTAEAELSGLQETAMALLEENEALSRLLSEGQDCS